jgi:hypothetical protein
MKEIQLTQGKVALVDDCALVYFGSEAKRFRQHFNKLGYVVIQDRS